MVIGRSILLITVVATATVGLSTLADARPTKSASKRPAKKASKRRSRKVPRFKGKRGMPGGARTLPFRSDREFPAPGGRTITADRAASPIGRSRALPPPAAAPSTKQSFWFPAATLADAQAMRLWAVDYSEWTPEEISLVAGSAADFKVTFDAEAAVFITCGVRTSNPSIVFEVTHDGVTKSLTPSSNKLDFAIVGSADVEDLRISPKSAVPWSLTGCEAVL